MAEKNESSEEKEFDATEQKLQQAREEGNVAQSKELNGLAVTLGILIGLELFRGPLGGVIFGQLSSVFAFLDTLARDMGSGTMVQLRRRIASIAGLSIVPVALIAVLVVLSIAAQQSFSFSPKKVKFDIDNILPAENIKKKYGTKGLVEFLKDSVKMLVAGVIALIFLSIFAINQYGASALSPSVLILGVSFSICASLILCFCIFQGVLAAVDWPYQRQQYLKDLKMTREEMKKQMKESEGDPYLKQQRREKASKLSRGEMVQAVKTSTVVMVNPTHYAVALRWDAGGASAPVCVAKGIDHLAKTIRETAVANGVPVYSDPPATRSIYRLVEIDEEIRPEHFAAVAAAIQYVDRVRASAADD